IGRSRPDSWRALEGCQALAESVCPSLRWTFNRHEIAMGGPQRNFAWFQPKRDASHCRVVLRVQLMNQEPVRDQVVEKLRTAGLDAVPLGQRRVRLSLSSSSAVQYRDVLGEVLLDAYRALNASQ